MTVQSDPSTPIPRKHFSAATADAVARLSFFYSGTAPDSIIHIAIQSCDHLADHFSPLNLNK
jgi:hypothetical protein